MQPYRFAVVGAGWRTDFFLRIARELPERFELCGVVVRSPEKGEVLEARWGVPTFRTPEALLQAVSPELWVSSVSYAANGEVTLSLLETGLPILTETPPAATLEEMQALWRRVREVGGRVQVAEQFHRQPHHAARLEAVRQGHLGPVHTAYVSLSHGYHGTSLIRRFLGVQFEPARIVGTGWTDRVHDSGGREGPPVNPGIKDSPQQIALLDFGGKQAVFDFTSVQYFSPIRAQRVCIRGEKGEIVDELLRTYNAEGEPITVPFLRRAAGPNGNLEGHHLQGIQLGDTWIYRNPTAPARLSDEEIAMAEMLRGMGEYARGGAEVYPLVEAMQDHYLGLCIRRACETGEPVEATPQEWARDA
ncbi:MAG: Gfo/Idh/MocA family protein [Armatimonadota bacterium]